MINMMKLGYHPGRCEWIYRAGDAVSAMAVWVQHHPSSFPFLPPPPIQNETDLESKVAIFTKSKSCLIIEYSLKWKCESDFIPTCKLCMPLDRARIRLEDASMFYLLSNLFWSKLSEDIPDTEFGSNLSYAFMNIPCLNYFIRNKCICMNHWI